MLEVAEWTCVHPKTIYRWIKEGKLYAIQFGPRIFRLPENATGEFLQQVSDNKADRQNVDGLDQAISRYKGEFLEGFSVGDPAPFDAQVCLKAEYLHHRFLGACTCWQYSWNAAGNMIAP